MRIVKADEWHKNHTKLSKYFFERIIQKVDSDESISHRHKTTNGFIMLVEVIETGIITIKRAKSIHRFRSLVEEAKSPLINSNVVNDFVIKKHAPDVVDYFNKLEPLRIKETNIYEIVIDCKKYLLRLKDTYYHHIFKELLDIEFDSEKFDVNSRLLDEIIECFIPFCIYKGYSLETIYDLSVIYIAKQWLGRKSIIKYLNNFKGNKRLVRILVRIEKDDLSSNFFLNYLQETHNIEEVNYDHLPKKFSRYNCPHKDESRFYTFQTESIDPHSKIRFLYDKSLKNYLLKGERLSLDYFTDFFENIYWKFESESYKFQTLHLPSDPINVKNRKSTLRSSLIKLSSSYRFKFDYGDDLPEIETLKDAIFYYNFALGSKSIENSISLLWTALECILPYRRYDTDIENVQAFVSKILSVGVIGRQLSSFLWRYSKTNKDNEWALDIISTPPTSDPFSPITLNDWANWLCTEFDKIDDPFYAIEPVSNLLCKEFCHLNQVYSGQHNLHKTVEYFIDKVERSEAAIRFQLDRIYLHRNQIVHGGKLINEYSNLWSHLEWYVGKLLSYAYIEYYISENPIIKENLYLELESQADSILNILRVNKKNNMMDVSPYFNTIFKHTWQYF